MSLTSVPDTSDIIESDLPLCEKKDSSSTAAQSLQDFNEYNRIALPLLVEASLQSIVQSKIAPIEEEVRTLFVDIVRRSQSTVARDFQQVQQLKTAQVQPSESAFATAQRSSYIFATDESYGAPMPVPSNAISADVVAHYQEPPFSDVSIGLSPFFCFTPILDKPPSDSGYGSNPGPCVCDCHLGVGSSGFLNGM